MPPRSTGVHRALGGLLRVLQGQMQDECEEHGAPSLRCAPCASPCEHAIAARSLRHLHEAAPRTPPANRPRRGPPFSQVNENTYVSWDHHCYGPVAWPSATPPPLAVLPGTMVALAGHPGQSCTAVCAEAKRTCTVRFLTQRWASRSLGTFIPHIASLISYGAFYASPSLARCAPCRQRGSRCSTRASGSGTTSHARRDARCAQGSHQKYARFLRTTFNTLSLRCVHCSRPAYAMLPPCCRAAGARHDPLQFHPNPHLHLSPLRSCCAPRLRHDRCHSQEDSGDAYPAYISGPSLDTSAKCLTARAGQGAHRYPRTAPVLGALRTRASG